LIAGGHFLSDEIWVDFELERLSDETLKDLNDLIDEVMGT
jgi:hypothetical protein